MPQVKALFGNTPRMLLASLIAYAVSEILDVNLYHWIWSLTEKKTGDKHVCPDGYTTLYDKDKGYAQYKVVGNRLRIYEVCGDGRYWYHLGAKICQDNYIPFIVKTLSKANAVKTNKRISTTRKGWRLED